MIVELYVSALQHNSILVGCNFGLQIMIIYGIVGVKRLIPINDLIEDATYCQNIDFICEDVVFHNFRCTIARGAACGLSFMGSIGCCSGDNAEVCNSPRLRLT